MEATWPARCRHDREMKCLGIRVATLRRGQLLEVEFEDHVEGAAQTYRFVVTGRLAKATRTTLLVDVWRYADDRTAFDSNMTRFAIVRSAIHRITRLERGEVLYQDRPGQRSK